jgi:hypothetical protein
MQGSERARNSGRTRASTMRRVEPEPVATLAASVSRWGTGAVEADFSPSKAGGYPPYRAPPTWPSRAAPAAPAAASRPNPRRMAVAVISPD